VSTGEWISLVSLGINTAATAVLITLRHSVTRAKLDTDVARDIADLQESQAENKKEIERLRDWRHNIVVPWQQNLMGECEKRFVSRELWLEARNADSPRPDDRRSKPR